ncbi:exodeoxyribonuclease I [Granulosicoccaceae sp. 1_MG-2023]|nr:exodeoxyribonuclease I [Granulosicoccaceae sp. 1_MG-2023]
MKSFYWFDYETFGTHPALDRPAQFAGLRTDENFNEIGEPLVIYCRQAEDYLPVPEASLVTGITPQLCNREGLSEAEFTARIHAELALPGTCNVGFNNIRFDDEFTRHLLFRNFFDAYQHEWKDGNSRWDLIDVVRLTRALRPDGINWPFNDDGTPNNKLENLTRLNGISHDAAHDALSDVRATVALARLLKERKSRLFEFVFKHRDKHSAADLLNLRNPAPVLHTSGRIRGEFGNTTALLPLARHPGNNNCVLCFDLREDPTPFLDLPAEEIALRLFSPKDELPEDMPRVPVKGVHINKCPVLVPLTVLDPASEERIKLSRAQIDKHAAALSGCDDFIAALKDAYEENHFDTPPDLDASLYSGGFFTDSDKRAFERLRRTDPAQLSLDEVFFDDPRIPEMLFRYRARNYPQTLDETTRAQWQEFCTERLCGLYGEGLNAYFAHLDALCEAHPTRAALLGELRDYADGLKQALNLH